MKLPGLYWMWADVRDWFLRIWFCHHNARVLADMEHRFSCVLTHCTRGMSKPYYTVEAMRAAIDEYIQGLCDNTADEAVSGYIMENGHNSNRIRQEKVTKSLSQAVAEARGADRPPVGKQGFA